MWNIGIPFNRLFAGILSYLWIFQLLLSVQNTTVKHILTLLLDYKDYSLPLVFLLLILSYPLGAVIQDFSYQFADKFLYKYFILKKNGYDIDRHKKRLRELNYICSDRTYKSLELKEQELSILGSASLNLLLISLTLMLEYKFEIFVVFLFTGMLIFSILVIRKYKSYNKYVDRVYDYIDSTNKNGNN